MTDAPVTIGMKPSHPGRFIRDEILSDLGLSVSKAAEDALLDQTLVQVDPDTYARFLSVLDQPPTGEGHARLMAAPKPWQG